MQHIVHVKSADALSFAVGALSVHTTCLSCVSEMSSVSTICAVCASLPFLPLAVTQSPDTHSAWMTARSSHDAAGATRLVPLQFCTRTVHRVKGAKRRRPL